MGLVTSVVDLEGIKSQYSKPSQSEKVNESFKSVLKDKFSNSTESMDAIFEEASSRFGVSVDLIKSVAKAESNFNTKAVSKAGAIGVMQLMPATARNLGVTDPYDARQNIMGGAKYIKQNLDRFNGNVSLALAAYNAGPDAVNRYGGIPPYEETQNYVRVFNSYMGTPISTGKTVTASNNGSASIYSRLLGGSSSAYVSLLNGDSQTSAGSKLAGIYGTSYGDLANAYGIGSSMNTMGMLLGSASMSEDGETITLSKESYVSLIQMLQLQMMMNASREVGSISI